METLLIFVGMAVLTYFTRYAMIVAMGRELPPPVRRWLGYIPPAVLAALVVPAALAPQGQVVIGLRAWAVLAGAAVAWRTGSVLWTIFAGLVVFWLLRALGL